MDSWNHENNNNEQDQYNQGGYYQDPRPAGKNGFLIASLICGILALLTFCTGIFPIFFGALGILFAVLSKRKGVSMDAMGITGIVLSAVGMITGVFLTIYSFYMVFSPNSSMPELRQQMNILWEQMYGMDMDEYMDQMLPDDGSL